MKKLTVALMVISLVLAGVAVAAAADQSGSGKLCVSGDHRLCMERQALIVDDAAAATAWENAPLPVDTLLPGRRLRGLTLPSRLRPGRCLIQS